MVDRAPEATSRLSADPSRAVLGVVAALTTLMVSVAPAGRAEAAQPPQPPPASGPSAVGLLVSSNSACTATVVTSSSRSLAVTAAHCVFDGGGWRLDDARFLPGYHDQQAPYGQWTVQTAWVATAWQRGGGAVADDGGQPVFDVAFLVLAPDGQGRRAQDVLGSHGIRFDARAGGEVTVLGYPGERGFDGEQLVSCTGTTESTPMTDGDAAGVGCRSAQGASGGPWLAGRDANSTGGAAVVAVLSSGEDARVYGDDARVYGHLFNADTESLYRQADQSG